MHTRKDTPIIEAYVGIFLLILLLSLLKGCSERAAWFLEKMLHSCNTLPFTFPAGFLLHLSCISFSSFILSSLKVSVVHFASSAALFIKFYFHTFSTLFFTDSTLLFQLSSSSPTPLNNLLFLHHPPLFHQFPFSISSPPPLPTSVSPTFSISAGHFGVEQ